MILYDEPTTGLDPVTASSIAELILTLQKELKIASIVVTHDLPTAYTVSDRAVVLSDGYKIFDGDIEDLGEQKDEFLQDYLKSSNRSHREAILKSVESGATKHSV
jgi:phospholipid/cholesterol/gamma-HCH transport system ATP-binding protein